MRIRWNPVQVMEAADELEGHVAKIVKPLEKAKAAAQQAETIPNLPDYVKYRFRSFVFEVERSIGQVHHMAGVDHFYQGLLKSRIADIRKEVPEDALAEAKAQPALFKRAM